MVNLREQELLFTELYNEVYYRYKLKDKKTIFKGLSFDTKKVYTFLNSVKKLHPYVVIDNNNFKNLIIYYNTNKGKAVLYGN